MKGYPTFPKALSLESRNQWFNVISRTPVVGGSSPSAEMQSVYSTPPANWAEFIYTCWGVIIFRNHVKLNYIAINFKIISSFFIYLCVTVSY